MEVPEESSLPALVTKHLKIQWKNHGTVQLFRGSLCHREVIYLVLHLQLMQNMDS